MFVGKDWAQGVRQARANANASQVPWVVWMYLTDVHCERATEADMAGESAKMRDGGKIVEPVAEPEAPIQAPINGDCPQCSRRMSVRETYEQGICNDCQHGEDAR